MAGFDLTATALRQREEMTAALAVLRANVPSLIRVDPATGRAHTSPDQLRQMLAEVVPGAGAALAETMLAYVDGGFVNLASEHHREPILIPWLAMEDLAYLLGGIPPGISKALGVDSRKDANGISDDLHARYGGLPPDIFSVKTASLLSHGPVWLAGRPLEPPDPIEPPERPPRTRPNSGGASTGHANVILGDVAPSSAPDIVQLVDCVIHGEWGPWWNDPVGNTGWILGFRVCLTRDCAERLAVFLLTFWVPGPLSLGSAFLKGLAQASVTAGIQSLCSVFTLYVSIVTFEIGFNIAYANNSRGVCVYCPWPWIGTPVFALSR